MLWRLRPTLSALSLFGTYTLGSGAIRVLVETVRINDKVLAGLTQPQIWSIALMILGAVLIVRGRRQRVAHSWDRRPGGVPSNTALGTRRDRVV